MTLNVLVKRAQSGDLHAFEAIVQEHQGIAITYAFSLLSDYHAAEDAAQEAFLAAWRNLGSLREPAALKGWLRRLVFTQCNRQQRRKTLKVVELEADGLQADSPTPAEDLETNQRQAIMRQAVAGLPQGMKEVVILYYFGGYSQKEPAAFLEVPVSTVNKRLHDARVRLKRRLERMKTDAPVDGDGTFSRRVIDKIVASLFHGSSVVGTVHTTIRAAGSKASLARTMGVLGHAFTFSMNKGCGRFQWEGNIDWWLFFDRLPSLDIGFEHFQTVQNLGPRKPPLNDDDLKALKMTTWKAVKAAVDRGTPAIAWAPMTVEQKEGGIGAFDWNLLVGYDEADMSYLVRSSVKDNKGIKEFQVPFDGFGYNDGAQWFCVLVPVGPENREAAGVIPSWGNGKWVGGYGGAGMPLTDRGFIAKQSLEDGVRFSKGTRYRLDYAVAGFDAVGLAAYELWQGEISAGRADIRYAPGWARLVQDLRHNAADFVVELQQDLPQKTHALLSNAAESYRKEVQIMQELARVCDGVKEDEAWNGGATALGATLVGEALTCERDALAALEKVVDMV